MFFAQLHIKLKNDGLDTLIYKKTIHILNKYIIDRILKIKILFEINFFQRLT